MSHMHRGHRGKDGEIHRVQVLKKLSPIITKGTITAASKKTNNKDSKPQGGGRIWFSELPFYI